MARSLAQRTNFQWWVTGLIPAVLIGLFIGLIMWATREGFRFVPTMVGSVLIGLCCHTAVWFLEVLFGSRVNKLPKGPAWIARGAIYVVGGSLGFFVGLLLALRTVFGLSFEVIFRNVNFAKPVGIAALIGLVIGIVFYTYYELRDRLELSIARLKEHEFAEKELELARSVQARLLPPQESQGEGYRIAARNLAARFVAGDFYDIFPMADGTVGVAVADVSGKGMGASLIMASVKATLPLLAGGKTVAETLTALNAKLFGELSKREFVALAFAKFDPATGRLEVANAGLPEPYIVRKGVPAEPVSSSGPRLPLGTRAAVAYEGTERQLQRGERMIMFSDGLPEASTGPEEQLGYEALAAMITLDGDHPPGEWLDRLFASVRSRTSEALEDDWTALVLERT